MPHQPKWYVGAGCARFNRWQTFNGPTAPSGPIRLLRPFLPEANASYGVRQAVKTAVSQGKAPNAPPGGFP